MKLNKISLFVSLSLFSTQMYANTELGTIYVKGNVNSTSSGKYSFTEKLFNTKLRANSHISDALASLPAVQVSNTHNGNTLGEITPQNISFHGERYYNNNFMLNGMGINDNINPIGLGANGVINVNAVKTINPEHIPIGHPQAFWLSPDLIGKVDVLESNVSSRYGSFTGGAVDAQLKEPNAERASGAISYRTTHSAWTRFHLDGAYKDEFQRATSPLLQPKFDKHETTIQLNQPLSAHSALLFAYSRQQSAVPQHQQFLHKWVGRHRRNESLLLSYKNEVNDNNRLLANAIYAPHYADEYLDNALDGRFRISGGGLLTNIKWENYNRLGLLTSELSYRHNRTQTKYDADTLYRYTKTDSINWISDPNTEEATKGGIGKRYTEQKSVQLKQHLQFKKLELAHTTHEASVGWEWQYNQSALKQPKLARQYTGARKYYAEGKPFDIENCTDCIPKEQYFTLKVDYLPLNGKVNHQRLAFYLEDKIKWRDVTFVPGMRFDYAQFTHKWNIAPRTYLDYDLFGQDKTHFSAGFNRYYAGDFVEYKLRSAFNASNEYDRDTYDSEWKLTKSQLNIAYKGNKIKTPYSDEWNVGVNQKIANSVWQLKWVKRQSKDQFITQVDFDAKPQQRWLSNLGKGTHHTISLEVENIAPIQTQYAELGWQAGLAWTKARTNQTRDYTQMDWNNFGVKKMLHNGKLDTVDHLPAQDFNLPWKGYAQLDSYFPSLNLRWAQRINYESASNQYVLNGFRCKKEELACQGYEGSVVKVNKRRNPHSITLDWFFDWKKPLTNNRILSVNMSILNVLNRVQKANQVTEDHENYYQTYRPGRQFWLGIKYEW
ncbi:membrane protein [[Haemophilus] ducreyi]|uniref:TonB-dependent receptor plug domain-containing protein n=1 Tax=Haemophilus ducreyi TaxID=730 RepID=UPI000656174B|nr:TonB-dependent receptor plug domain-containing protein [[Haemophilus] ducreyi]AKO36421.1 membrane protein [[Haemophilus] ducreyi]AKO37882.1 membrane protein [[Haemophilus] ducreyi]AKO42374.1 membrane protein [[Haemophilus] ducreyi]ANF71188.1 hypothetical protein A6043_07725 [[Haemophilus] ducreyi]ANF71630.1 hypothetical protein A6044_01375 [[Haemophilus] ducreyi]